jgi:hypothetical protein
LGRYLRLLSSPSKLKKKKRNAKKQNSLNRVLGRCLRLLSLPSRGKLKRRLWQKRLKKKNGRCHTYHH